MKNPVLRFASSFLVLSGAPLLHADTTQGASGALDLPLPTVVTVAPGAVGAVVEDLEPAPGVVDQKTLVEAVRAEQDELEKLDRRTLERKAEGGERGAQVALGADFAKEAESLAFAPQAANDALSDAVRWYSLAASRGYPGAPALDQAGVDFFPVRVQRPLP